MSKFVTTSLCLPSEVDTVSRRQLIQNGVSLVAFSSLAPFVGRAATPIQRKLVWINLNGGWDILEATDPKQASTSGVDMVYDWGGAHPLKDGDGTRIGRWLSNIASLGSQVLVVRGLAMGTTSHEAGSVYMDTGILSNAGRVNAASVPAIVASESSATVPIIQLSGGSEPMTDRGLLNPVSVVRAENLDLYRSMYPTSQNQIERRLEVLDYLKSTISVYQESVGANDRLSNLAAAEAKIRAQFEGNVGAKLRLTNEDRAPFSSAGQSDGTSDAFALATKLIKGDIVSCVNLGIGGFDTHASQTSRLEPIMTRVDRLVSTMTRELERANKLSTTLIVLYSDFGRTPKVNGSDGRDHWPVGGAMLIGGNIVGGRAVGSTDSNLRAENINLTSGTVDSSGEQINPTHIGGSVLSLTLGSAYMTYRPYLTALDILTRTKS
jgi:hypothetical protein